MKPAFDFRPMTAAEEDLALFKAVFDANGDPRSLFHLRWQYLSNPVGRLFVDFAIDNQADRAQPAAVYAAIPTRFKVGNDHEVAVQSIDTLTDHAYRGRGLFIQLATSLYQRCEHAGVSFVYGFPNANSAHGFFTRLGWTSFDPIPFLIRPLRTSFFMQRLPLLGRAAKHLPDIRIPSISRAVLDPEEEVRLCRDFGAEFDDLWRSVSTGLPVCLERDRQYLAWRFGRPGAEYTTLCLYSKAVLQGFVTFCVRERPGGGTGVLMELLYRDAKHGGNHRQGKLLLRSALRNMKSAGVDYVAALVFPHSPTYRAYRSCGFLPIPESMRVGEAHMGVKALALETQAGYLDRRQWYISFCDADTV